METFLSVSNEDQEEGEVEEEEEGKLTVDSPLPKRAVMIMKYFWGFNTWSSPMSHSLSAIAIYV